MCQLEVVQRNCHGSKSDIFILLLPEESFEEKLEIFCLSDKTPSSEYKIDSVLLLTAAVLFKIIANIFHLIHT